MVVDLYTWYHQVKKKDLGDAKENWLQHLQEQALLKKRAQKERKGHGGSPGMPAGDYFESGLREGSSGRASTKNSKCSTPRTPEKLMKSPFSALLDSSFITPTLVLSHSKDDGTPETSRVSPPFNPSALGLDLFSPLVSKTNTSVKIAASLGANLDDSESLWTSALATPLATDASGQTPTTLERLTLHPKQGLRQKVMVRSLFSPRTPGTSTHTDESPNLGIIKCYSPIPTFNNRALLNQQKQMPENNFFPLVDDTQSFRVYDKANNSEEGKQLQIDGTNQLEGSVLAQNTINSDRDSGLEQKAKGPGQILHHGTDFSLPSSPEESLGCHKLGNDLKPGKGTQLCKDPSILSISPTSAEVRKVGESGLNLQRNHIGTSNSGEGSMLQDRFQACSEENQSKSPFDLICSPIKGKSTGDSNMHDARELESPTEDQESLCNKKIEENSYAEQMSYECTVYEKETLSAASETTMPEENICDHSASVEEKSSPMTKEPPKTLSVPLFKKENKVMKELYKKDEGSVIEGYTSTPDSKAVLKKLSIHKNKRHSGKFLYPRKSEAGYEKLNMKYQECLDDAQSTVVETDIADITTEHVSRESKVAKIPKDIHDIANRQQNFVSLATLEKDDRLGLEKILKTSETKCSAQMEKGRQEEPVKQDSEKTKIVSGKLPEETAICPSREEERAIDFAKVNITSKDERSEVIQPKPDDLQTDIGLQVVPQKDLKSKKEMMEHSGGTVTFKAEKFELPLSQSLKSEASEAMDDSFNDIDFAEIDWNFCVPNAKTETDHRSGKDLTDDHSLKGDCEDAGKGTKGFCGFSTGLGKSVKVSDKALQHAKKLLEDTLEEEYVKDKVSNIEDIRAYPNSVSKNTGVKTVHRHNKKSMPSNFERSEYIMEKDAKSEDFSGDANYCSFSNGGGKPVNVCKEPMQGVKVLEQVSGHLNLQSHQSEASSSVSENLFHHKADQLACLEKVSKESASNAKLVQDTNIGFKTARGTNIVVNPEALNKVKRLWEEEMKLEDQQAQTLSVMDDTEFGFKGNETFDSNIKFQKNLQPGNAMSGFATAAGKALTVSEKALKKAQGLLEESSEEAKLHYSNLSGSVDSTRQVLREEKEGKTIQNQRSNTPALKDEARDIMNRENYQESKTSSSSAVLISHKYMDETKELTEEFADVDGKCSGDKLSCAQVKGPTKSRDCEQLQQFGGFSTARGTKVRISNAALLRARKLWEEDDATSGNTLQSMVLSEVSETQTKEREKSLHSNKEVVAPSPHNFLGFCTGQGKPVEISKESLARSRNIFEDIDIPEDEKSHSTSVEVLQPERKPKDFADVGGRNLEVIGGHEVRNPSSVLDLEEKLAGEETAYNFNQNFDSHRGFVTGRGKCVEVKEETLKRMRKMFMDDNDIIECDKNLEYNKNNLNNVVILNMDGENASKKEKLREHEDEHIEEIIDFSDKEQDCAGNKERERTPSPILGSQKSTSRLAALDRGVPIKCGKRKFSELGLAELDPDKQIARPSNKRLSLGNSRNTNGIPRKSILRLGRRGHSQSAQTSLEMRPSPAAKSQSQPTFLAPSPHPPPPENHTKAQDNLQTLGKTTALTDTQEICAITEAFLEDDLREGKDSLESFNRKRSREASGYDGPSGKKFRVPQMPCGQMEDEEAYAADEVVESGREMARLKQSKMARYKEKRPVTPIQGVLHKFRSDEKHSRIKMQSLGSLKVNRNVSCKVASINASNAKMYRFPVKDRRCETVTCEDGCTLVPSSDGFIGVKEIEQGFLAAPGVHPGLVPPSWVINHYRWIVWKLAALERRLLHSALTPENVMARLKYRYDREIDRAERPVLRKIMEHDDVPQKTMVLCVAHIKKTPETTHGGDGVAETRPRSPYVASETILELTDGWYSIDALTDTALSRFVLEEKVKIGTKLLIHGAEMAKHSPPCHPLQAPPSVCLRLHANMTRRAKWWSRLGLAPQCGPLPTMIRGIQGDGGLVGRLTVLLARVYPPLYFEKTGGKSVFRSERAHNRLLRENQREKERNVHQILAEVEREFDSRAASQRQSRKTSRSVLSGEEICNLTSGKDIAEVMEEAMDPSSLEGLLSTQQIELARSWRLREAEERKRLIHLEVQRRLAKKQKLYEAVTILKIRIVDTEGGSALVTIWRPTEEIIQALTEGTVFSVHYLCANGHKYGDLQLTATRQTRWERVTSPSLSQFQDVSRDVTPLCLTSSGELAPLWREVDVVGIVLRVGGLEAGCQLVHLVDHQVNILALKFWGGIKECGMEDVVQVGALLCVSNGSWRGHTGGRFGCVHITELTAVTTQPRRPHLEEQASHLKKSVENVKTLLCEGDMKLDGQFSERVSPEGGTSPSREQSRQGRENGQGATAPENAQGDYQREHKDGTPSTGLSRLQQRSREIRSKLQALGSYGTPSALRSLKSPASRGTHKPFRMPFRQPLDSAKNE